MRPVRVAAGCTNILITFYFLLSLLSSKFSSFLEVDDLPSSAAIIAALAVIYAVCGILSIIFSGETNPAVNLLLSACFLAACVPCAMLGPESWIILPSVAWFAFWSFVNSIYTVYSFVQFAIKRESAARTRGNLATGNRKPNGKIIAGQFVRKTRFCSVCGREFPSGTGRKETICLKCKKHRKAPARKAM